MKLVHYIMALVTVAVMGTGIFGLATSCKPAALPAEPDVVVTYPDAGSVPIADSASPSPAPTPAPTVTADASAPCVSACANLATLPCAVASDLNACAAKCTQVQSSHLTPFDTQCMTTAKTTAVANACAGIVGACP